MLPHRTVQTYPHYAPCVPDKAGEFTGWMLLSYDKPVESFSSKEDHGPENVVDEHVKSFWVAEKNNDEQWLEIDLVNRQRFMPSR